jgi:hypothetical protein
MNNFKPFPVPCGCIKTFLEQYHANLLTKGCTEIDVSFDDFINTVDPADLGGDYLTLGNRVKLSYISAIVNPATGRKKQQKKSSTIVWAWRYCPYCGAKMNTAHVELESTDVQPSFVPRPIGRDLASDEARPYDGQTRRAQGEEVQS